MRCIWLSSPDIYNTSKLCVHFGRSPNQKWLFCRSFHFSQITDTQASLVRQVLSQYSVIFKYFGINRGAKKENSPSSATDKQRRDITKDDEIIIHEFSAWRITFGKCKSHPQ